LGGGLPLKKANVLSIRNSLLVINYQSIKYIPPAVQSTELLQEAGIPVVLFEFDIVREDETPADDEFQRIKFRVPTSKLLNSAAQIALLYIRTFSTLFLRCLTQGKPKFIICHGLATEIFGYLLKRLFGIPYAVHVHEIYDSDQVRRTQRFLLRFEGRSLRKADFTIFPEISRAEIYRTRYKLRKDIEIAYNCPRLRLGTEERDLKTELNIPNNAALMLYLGGVGGSNGIEEAVRALPELPNLYFVLVGWYSEPGYEKKLTDLATELGVGERLLWRGSTGNKWSWYNNADIGYCVYAPTEIRRRFNATASNKLMESIAAGLPVIAGPSADFVDVVEKLGLGICAKEITPSALAEAIRSLLSNKSRLSQIRERGKSLHKTELNFEKQYEVSFRRVLGYFEMSSNLKVKESPIRKVG
jgi:glycosyltransferase involved in cell wall biosynthesis